MENLEDPSTIRVLVADDERRARRALAALLATYPQLEVIGQAADGLQAVALAVELQPDVVVLDGIMPGLDGLGAVQRIKALAPQIAVILLTLYGDLEWDARQSGADGFLVKSADSEEIIDLITRLGSRAAALRSPSMDLSPQGVTS
jgi:DNA-binding NarL/FixJ family response regulator